METLQPCFSIVEYYHETLAALDEIESIRADVEAKATDDEVILFSRYGGN
ncbi:MAG: hypothetical protein ACR2HX_20510 [Pyrinomonadaceae bacterium]